ncbi:MAG: S8 family serine peptidase [Acidobacteria bacterium]|nr:S8 family serine peptidase [Acidobacteriota bacterium]
MKNGRGWQILIGIAPILLAGLFPAAASAQNQFIVRAPAAAVGGVADRHGLKVLDRVNQQDIFLLQGPVGADPQILVADLRQDPDVAESELNGDVFIPEALQGAALNQSTASILGALANRTLITYFGSSVWTSYVNQPAAAIIRVAEAQRLFATGAGVVAVIDTGIDPKHPALSAVLVPGYDFTRNLPGLASDWADLNQSTASILDQSTASILDNQTVVILNQSTASILDQSTASILDTSQIPRSFGHGTMVAGLVHLVAPTAKLMPLKAFKADGSSNVFDILRAIYYATQNGARVINMSFSLAGSSQEFARAVSFATEHGAACVASAGNSGKEVLVFPAALRNVISIASTNNLDVRSSFSNFGAALVSVAAPGEALITTYPGNHYAAAWGTSFSTALASGGAALLFQLDPQMSPDKVEGSFSKAAKVSQDLGAGRIDLVLALSSRAK